VPRPVSAGAWPEADSAAGIQQERCAGPGRQAVVAIMGSAQLAEDPVEEAFVSAWMSWRSDGLVDPAATQVRRDDAHDDRQSRRGLSAAVCVFCLR
jgi:hypothetical protein